MARITEKQKQTTEREIRSLLAKGFSQRESASRLGISRGQLFNIFHHRTGVGPKSAAAVKANAGQDQRMLVLRDYGAVWVDPTNKFNRSLIGGYWDAVGKARRENDWSPLEKFKGRSVTIIDKGQKVRLKLVTDPNTLRRLEDQSQLDPIEVARYGMRRAKRGKHGMRRARRGKQ